MIQVGDYATDLIIGSFLCTRLVEASFRPVREPDPFQAEISPVSAGENSRFTFTSGAHLGLLLFFSIRNTDSKTSTRASDHPSNEDWYENAQKSPL